MQTITVEEAQSHLAEIIEKLAAGEDVVLTRDGIPLAAIRKFRSLGTLKGTVLYIAPDFDDIPEGFEDYLP